MARARAGASGGARPGAHSGTGSQAGPGAVPAGRAGRRPASSGELDELIAGLLESRPRAVARAISVVEDSGPLRRRLVAEIYPRTGRARVIGVTGPPGAGKSTLVDRLAQSFRRRDQRVAILAVDPTSPFSGGAILGDRIRMHALYTDPGVFIRSMATRGAMGGLARATHDAVDLVDAAGFDWVLVETVGVGQDEVDVVRSVDSVVVVTVPGLGDDIQAIKAGIMEIADLFVINKADRDGVQRARRDIELMLGLAETDGWRAPVLETVASRGEGIEPLVAEIDRHCLWLEEGGGLTARRRRRMRQRVEALLQERVLRTAVEVVGLEQAVERAFAARVDPYRVADEVYRGVVARDGGRRRLIRGIDHVGIAVRSIEEARGFWQDLGLVLEGIEEVPQEGVRVALLACGDSRIELLEALAADSPIARFIERRGPGIHHLCLATDALETDDARLRGRGHRLLRARPSRGAGGCWVQFIHPASAGGVLVELSQPAG